MNEQQFVAQERASRDTIDVKRIYIDMAGDLMAGVLLSQLVYYHLPDREGQTKLRVMHDGQLWVAKRHQDWWEECRLTTAQARRAIDSLCEGGDNALVIRHVYKFNGDPWLHLRINWPAFLKSHDDKLAATKTISAVAHIGVRCSAYPVTETTTKTTLIEDTDEAVSSIDSAGVEPETMPVDDDSKDWLAELEERKVARNSLSPTARFYFDSFGRKRWANQIQANAFGDAEKAYGPEVMRSAIEWAGTKGIADVGRIIKAAATMVKKNGDPKTPKHEVIQLSAEDMRGQSC